MTESRPIISVKGEKVAIGPVRRDLIPLYQAWINNVSEFKSPQLKAVTAP